MMEIIKKNLYDFTSKNNFPYAALLFQKGLYLWCLGTLLMSFPLHQHLWGPLTYSLSRTQTLLQEGGQISFLLQILDPLSLPQLAPYYLFFIGGQMLALILGILGIAPRLMAVIITYLNFVINNKNFSALTGGHHLLEAMLMYQMFFTHPEKKVRGFWDNLSITFSNSAFIIARIQLVVVYAVSGLSKLQGDLWTSGTALYYVLNTNEFALPWLQKYFSKNEFFILGGTYATVLYQLAFPYLIWFKKCRPTMLIIGSFLHLQIAWVMGLLDFGLAMMVCYIVFYSEVRAEKILLAFKNPTLWVQKREVLQNIS